VADLRRIWIGKRQPFMARHLERLAFIDETSLKTNMVKTTGWAPRGQRLVDHAPFGHWRTQTFIGALRHDRLSRRYAVINLAMPVGLADKIDDGMMKIDCDNVEDFLDDCAQLRFWDRMVS